MITFREGISVPILNHLTGRRYELAPATEVSINPATLARIVAICNEPNVYQWLFRDLLEGRPYPAAMAREWIEWAHAGWRSQSHFVFIVRDELQCVAAACDIKSNALTAEIGYWSSREHRGVMTNAVVALCTLAAEAGFVGLYARTKKNNLRSEAVLERAGFSQRQGETDDFGWFTRTLKRDSNDTARANAPG